MNNTLISIIEKYDSDKNQLLQILLEVQKNSSKNYVSEEKVGIIAEELKIPKSRVYSVITFYDALSDKPRGKNLISLCNSSACSLLTPDESVSKFFTKELGINPGETTEDGNFTLNYSPCFGACDIAPAVRINDSIYGNLTQGKVKSILKDFSSGDDINELMEILPDRKVDKTVNVITSNFGKYDGYDIDEYIKLRGFDSFQKAADIGIEKAINEITESGIRGRGGAQYPTGRKLAQSCAVEGDRKFIICNADEGEPGTFKDRELLKNDPYKVIEGMMISSYISGASEGIIYLREEYSWIRSKLDYAIASCYKRGYLGKNIMGSGHDFDLKVFSGAGSYVCGEGFAMCESLEGKRGIPRVKPPYVKQAGYLNYPTLILNVETLSAVASFLKDGSSVFTDIGTKDSPGSKVICVSGKVNNPGVYEVPFGLTFNEIINDIAGGMASGSEIGFIQVGGASGGIIPSNLLDTVYDYENICEIGLGMGSGAILVSDMDTDFIEYISVVQDFFFHESCGKCTPCREGNNQLKKILSKFLNSEATEADLKSYKSIVNVLKIASACGSGKTEATPLRCGITYFEEAFRSRIVNK